MAKFECPDSIEELEELDKLIPLCRKDLHTQAEAKIKSGAACSLSEASRQLGEDLGRNPWSIRRSIQRQQEAEGATVSHLTQKFTPKTEYQKTIIEEHEEGKQAEKLKKRESLKEKQESIKEQGKQELKIRPSLCKATCFDWLKEQPQCDLIITDPPYMTDVEDIYKFAEWLPYALSKVKPTGRAYVCIGAYPEEIEAYLQTRRPSDKILANILVWTYRNTLGPSP